MRLPRTVAVEVSEALEAAGKLHTPSGAIAMSLAEAIDESDGTGNTLAVLSRELRLTLEGVIEPPQGQTFTGGLLDQVARKRGRPRNGGAAES